VLAKGGEGLVSETEPPALGVIDLTRRCRSLIAVGGLDGQGELPESGDRLVNDGAVGEAQLDRQVSAGVQTVKQAEQPTSLAAHPYPTQHRWR